MFVLIAGVQFCFGGHEEAFVEIGGGDEPNRLSILNAHAEIVKLIGGYIRMIGWAYLNQNMPPRRIHSSPHGLWGAKGSGCGN